MLLDSDLLVDSSLFEVESFDGSLEALELEDPGDDGLTVEADEDEGAAGGVVTELLELDELGVPGLESARGEVAEDEDEDAPGLPGAPGVPWRSQPASATAPMLATTRRSLLTFLLIEISLVGTQTDGQRATLTRCRCRYLGLELLARTARRAAWARRHRRARRS